MTQDLVKDLDVVKGAGRVGALYAQNAHPDLVAQGRLPCILVGREGVPPDVKGPLEGVREVYIGIVQKRKKTL